MNEVFLFLKRWGLVVSMLTGASAYFLFINIEALEGTRALAGNLVQVAQPSLLFMMLLLTFLKVKPSDLHLRKWQMGGLALQGCFWVLGALALMYVPCHIHGDWVWKVSCYA